MRKRYGQVEALGGVDLKVEPGGVVALLGPNGAGKTTAISVILGLRRPTAGSVALFGRPPGERETRARCGVMLQDSGLPELLKVAELVDVFRSHFARPLDRNQVLELAGVGDIANKRFGQLSGGQRQRVYYAIAICGDPDVLFLDEPTVGMDVEARRRLHAEVRRLASRGRTIMLTTHYLEEADQLSDRVIVIDRGRVIADSTPSELKARVPGKRVRVTAARALREADFVGLPVEHLELSDHSARALTQRPVEVVLGLSAHGVQVTDLEVVGADLEDAFLSLTGREHAP